MNTNASLVVFTDLDGTLLDHHSYSFREAAAAIDILMAQGVPWLFNTSKTFAELRQLRRDLNNPWPMIVENGSGVAIPNTPESSHLFATTPDDVQGEQRDGFQFYSLGLRRADFLPRLRELGTRFKFLGYQDMTIEKLVELTGLSPEQAGQSLDRQYTEPCVWLDTDNSYDEFVAELDSMGLRCVRGGRFAHIMGKTDKGVALKWVMNTYFPGSESSSVALGDGENDLPMLNSADIAILVRSPVHDLPAPCLAKESIVTEEPGPAGWAGAIIALLERQEFCQYNKEPK